MALNIEGATLGYNAFNIQKLKNDINTNVIQRSITTMNIALVGLRTEVDKVWVGASAEQFKSNMEADVNKISEALHASYDTLCSELNQIIEKMDELDRNLVQGRRY